MPSAPHHQSGGAGYDDLMTDLSVGRLGSDAYFDDEIDLRTRDAHIAAGSGGPSAPTGGDGCGSQSFA